MGSGLPVSIAGGPETPVSLELEWLIDSCTETYQLDEIAIDLEMRTQDDNTTVEAPLPHHAIAVLGRFAAESVAHERARDLHRIGPAPAARAPGSAW